MIRSLLILSLLALAGCGKSPESSTSPASSVSSPRPPFVAMARTTGTSMLPTFADGEVVMAEFCDYGSLRGNDTVIRWDPIFGIFVHHRLESRDATGLWTTRGDNNPGTDRGRMTAETFVARTRKFGTP